MIAVVIVNFRRPDITKEAVLSVISNAAHPYVIVVVDNSEDGGSSLNELLCYDWPILAVKIAGSIEEEVLPIQESCLYVIPASNKGFAAANNIALKYLLHVDTVEFVLLLNNDALLLPYSLFFALEQFRKRKTLGLLGFCLLEHNNLAMIQYLGGRYNYYTGRLVLCGEGESYASEEPYHYSIDYPAGAAMMLRIKAFQQTGFMEESFFLYGEELDLSEKMRSNHWDVDYCYKATVSHMGAATLGAGSSCVSLQSDFYWLRSRWLLSKRYSRLSAISFSITSLVYPLRRMLLGQWKRVSMYFWVKRHPNLFFEDFISENGTH
jgi:GT2 family glycosyltransferase